MIWRIFISRIFIQYKVIAPITQALHLAKTLLVRDFDFFRPSSSLFYLFDVRVFLLERCFYEGTYQRYVGISSFCTKTTSGIRQSTQACTNANSNPFKQLLRILRNVQQSALFEFFVAHLRKPYVELKYTAENPFPFLPLPLQSRWRLMAAWWSREILEIRLLYYTLRKVCVD